MSIGDFVLSGGELPAALIVDAVTRLLPGALGNEASSQNESFARNPSSTQTSEPTGAQRSLGRARDKAAPLQSSNAHAGSLAGHGSRVADHVLLDFPHYTRPADFRGWKVPEVLIGGNHAEVAKWRRAAAMEKTRRNRRDLVLP
jgi:tRNA (guanine37-N1)-methyltransferase